MIFFVLMELMDVPYISVILQPNSMESSFDALMWAQ